MADQVQHRPFGVRFGEAIDFLKAKLPEASVAWDSLAGPVHAKVFTVAGATSADLASDIHQSLVEALANGETITSFRKGFDAAVQKHGWAYNGKRGWRTNIIFDTNMRTSHMAGRWAQIEANKERRPFLQYRTAGDARVRPAHRQWNGRIFPVGDSFWSTHYPPNGWNCRCTVRAYSQADLTEKGLQQSPPYPMETRQVVSRDGTVTDVVPKGIDPGWDHNVGQSWINPELALGHKLARLPRELQGLLVDKTITPAYQQVIEGRWKTFRDEAKAAPVPKGEAQIVGFLDSRTLDGLAKVVPALKLESTAVAAFDDQLPALLTPPTPAATAAGAAPAWPAAWIDGLPGELRAYRAVLWDKIAGHLVVVPQGTLGKAAQPHLPKIVMRPNEVTKFGEALAVIELGSAEIAELLNAGRYAILAGQLR